jgi:hypothetical protein
MPISAARCGEISRSRVSTMAVVTASAVVPVVWPLGKLSNRGRTCGLGGRLRTSTVFTARCRSHPIHADVTIDAPPCLSRRWSQRAVAYAMVR